jgi:hypothetical protein
MTNRRTERSGVLFQAVSFQNQKKFCLINFANLELVTENAELTL